MYCKPNEPGCKPTASYLLLGANIASLHLSNVYILGCHCLFCWKVGKCNLFCNFCKLSKNTNKQINLENSYLTNLCVYSAVFYRKSTRNVITRNHFRINRVYWQATLKVHNAEVWVQQKHIEGFRHSDACAAFFPGGNWYFDFSFHVLTCLLSCDSFVSYFFPEAWLLFLFSYLSTLAMKLHLPGVNTKTERWLWGTWMTNMMC